MLPVLAAPPSPQGTRVLHARTVNVQQRQHMTAASSQGPAEEHLKRSHTKSQPPAHWVPSTSRYPVTQLLPSEDRVAALVLGQRKGNRQGKGFDLGSPSFSFLHPEFSFLWTLFGYQILSFPAPAPSPHAGHRPRPHRTLCWSSLVPRELVSLTQMHSDRDQAACRNVCWKTGGEGPGSSKCRGWDVRVEPGHRRETWNSVLAPHRPLG